MAEEEKVVNPNIRKEVGSGLKNSLLTFLGVVLEIAGIGVVLYARSARAEDVPLYLVILGNLIWVVGTALIVWTIVKNFKANHGKGFNVANVVIKIVLMIIFLALLIGVNSIS